MKAFPSGVFFSTPTTERSEVAHGRFWIAVSAVLFGAMAVATRAVSKEIGAAQIAVMRFAIGLVGVLLSAAWRPSFIKATNFRGLTMRGLFGGMAVLGYFMAIERLSAGLGTLLNYTFPLWASIFAAFTLGERLTIRTGIGMLMATTGLVVIIGPQEVSNVLHGLGDPRIQLGLAAGLTSSVFGGAATTTVRALRRTESALAIFGAFCCGGLLVCLPMALLQWKPISLHAALLLLLIGSLSFFAQFLFTYSLKFIAAGAGSLTTQITVVASYTLAALFLGESIGRNVLIGGGIVMAGVFVVSFSGATKPARSPNIPEPQVE